MGCQCSTKQAVVDPVAKPVAAPASHASPLKQTAEEAVKQNPELFDDESDDAIIPSRSQERNVLSPDTPNLAAMAYNKKLKELVLDAWAQLKNGEGSTTDETRGSTAEDSLESGRGLVADVVEDGKPGEESAESDSPRMAGSAVEDSLVPGCSSLADVIEDGKKEQESAEAAVAEMDAIETNALKCGIETKVLECGNAAEDALEFGRVAEEPLKSVPVTEGLATTAVPETNAAEDAVGNKKGLRRRKKKAHTVHVDQLLKKREADKAKEEESIVDRPVEQAGRVEDSAEDSSKPRVSVYGNADDEVIDVEELRDSREDDNASYEAIDAEALKKHLVDNCGLEGRTSDDSLVRTGSTVEPTDSLENISVITDAVVEVDVTRALPVVRSEETLPRLGMWACVMNPRNVGAHREDDNTNHEHERTNLLNDSSPTSARRGSMWGRTLCKGSGQRKEPDPCIIMAPEIDLLGEAPVMTQRRGTLLRVSVPEEPVTDRISSYANWMTDIDLTGSSEPTISSREATCRDQSDLWTCDEARVTKARRSTRKSLRIELEHFREADEIVL